MKIGLLRAKDGGQDDLTTQWEAAWRIAPALPRRADDGTISTEPHLRLMVESSTDAIFAFSMARKPVYLNSAVEKLTGYTVAEIATQKFVNWIHPADQENMLNRWEDLYAGKGYENVEFRLITKSGEIKWCLSSWGPMLDGRGQQVGVQGRERDITALKRAERARNELSAIVESSEDAIFSMTLDGAIVSWNRSAARIYGYSADEMIGQSVAVLLMPTCATKLEGILADVAGGRSLVAREVVHHRKDGVPVSVSLTVSPVKNDGESVTGVSVIARDVTERNRLEKHVVEACMAERRRIGHELHDGLAAYLTGLTLRGKVLQHSLEKAGVPAALEAKELVGLMSGAVHRARRLARGEDPAEIERMGLDQAMTQLASETEALFGVRCSFQSAGSFRGLASSILLCFYRILQESIHNAIRHGNARLIQAELVMAEDLLRLSVRDDGVGFDVEDQTLEGMGLRIMGYRARSVGADLSIRAAPGKGTRIECCLRISGA